MSARLVVIGWLFWLGLSAACGQSQPSSSSWQSGFRLFLMSPSSAGAGGAPRVSRVNRSSVVYTPRRASRPAAAPARPAELRTDTGQQIDCDAFIRNGRTYVALRDFLAQLREKFGIVIGVEYLGGGKVELRLRDDELWFARGLAHLWSGRVAEALRAFEQAARLNGDYAAPARELAAWLRDGLAPSQLSLLGVIRIEWWNLPDDIKVYIDSASETIEVPHGAPLLVVADGIYTLRLVDKHGKELVNQPFRVRHDQVFEVELRGSNV